MTIRWTGQVAVERAEIARDLDKLRKCAHCGRTVFAIRARKVAYCGTACRVAAFRARTAEAVKQLQEVEQLQAETQRWMDQVDVIANILTASGVERKHARSIAAKVLLAVRQMELRSEN